VYAQQSFTRAEASERAVRLVSSVIDSLAATAAPASGERIGDGAAVRWTVGADSAPDVTLIVDYIEAGRIRRETFVLSR
jgi:hypothetical protein